MYHFLILFFYYLSFLQISCLLFIQCCDTISINPTDITLHAKRIALSHRRSWFRVFFFYYSNYSTLVVRMLHGFNLLLTFRYAVLILIYQFTISEVIELVRTRDHIEDLTEGLFLALTFVALCIKYGNFLARRDQVSTLLNCFRGEMCRPKDSEEKMILIRYHRKGIGIVNLYTFHLASHG